MSTHGGLLGGGNGDGDGGGGDGSGGLGDGGGGDGDGGGEGQAVWQTYFFFPEQAYSSLTAHCSSLTTHCSLLTTYHQSACAEAPGYGGNGWCATAVNGEGAYINKWGGCTLCSQPPLPSPPPPPPAPPCTYTLMSDAVSWADADAACQAAGLQLASVQSAAQNALLVTAAAGNQVWIGGTDAASEGTWVWSPSNTPLSYTNWAPGQPGPSRCTSPPAQRCAAAAAASPPRDSARRRRSPSPACSTGLLHGWLAL